MQLNSIYDISLNSASNEPNFLEQFKGKTTLLVNTTVGCGNANQMEVLQWLQEKYQDQGFEIIAIPTNDYCGPGVTKGRWSQGITCGSDSEAYGKEVYNTTFNFSEMVSSNPNPNLNHELDNGLAEGTNGLGQPTLPPHEMYVEIANQMLKLAAMNRDGIIKDDIPENGFLSPWLNHGFYNGAQMGGNFEKYLIDSDGYVVKHFTCTSLNYDVEKTLKESMLAEGIPTTVGEGRTMEVFNEEYSFICSEIEKVIAGAKSAINPLLVKL